MDHVIHVATKGISLGIATASEAVAGRKRRKGSEHDTYPTLPNDEDATERDWELDEAAEEQLPPYETDETLPTPTTAEEVSQSFLNRHKNIINVTITFTPLPQPIIIPQRRPRNRSRGFVRAYAPSLGECAGIDQDMFLDFLNDFDRASKASPVFHVLNMACFAVGFIPNGIAQAVSAGVGTAVLVAQELQTRYKSNRFLDHINEALFKPRGLYVMVMTYKPDLPDDAILDVDMSDPTSVSLAKSLARDDNKVRQVLGRFRVGSGTAHGDIQIPEPAPLIFPSLDMALAREGNSSDSRALTENKTDKSVVKRSAAVQDYLDRRAQSEYLLNNPDGKLNKIYTQNSDKQYINRFCDPDHPVNSGSIFALLTGGTFDPISSGRVHRAERRASKNNEPALTDAEKHDAYMGRKVRGKAMGTPSKSIPLIGKMLKKGLLYLVVCNLPVESTDTDTGGEGMDE